jgi:hypothetical protein|tara:strand:+ start:1039 stop:1155 length:117 start_codon:yes stop_codon:yes gene_type:complete
MNYLVKTLRNLFKQKKKIRKKKTFKKKTLKKKKKQKGG